MDQRDGPTGISVTGVGRVTIEAEIATLRVGVSASETGLEEARVAVAAKATAARDHLVSSGVEHRDIKTASLSVHTNHDRRLGRRTHYVSTQLTATIRTLDTAEAIVNELFSVIGDGMDLHGLSFGTEDPNRGREMATALAFEDAKAKATNLAELAGVQLGAVIAVSEADGGFHRPPPMMRAAAMASAESSIPVEAGELDQEVVVSVRWAID